MDDRQRLVEAAAGLIHAGSYPLVTVADICERAGVGPERFAEFFQARRDVAIAALEWQFSLSRSYVLEPAFKPDVAKMVDDAGLHPLVVLVVAHHDRLECGQHVRDGMTANCLDPGTEEIAMLLVRRRDEEAILEEEAFERGDDAQVAPVLGRPDPGMAVVQQA